MQYSPLDSLNAKATEALIVEVLKTIYDPELPVSIYELGLIYSVNVDVDGVAVIEMTISSGRAAFINRCTLPRAASYALVDSTLNVCIPR